jgi:hypothetical protein
VATACLLSLPAAVRADPVVGQIDTFQDGTTQNWQVGPAAPPAAQPTNIVSGGPNGADDNYLRLTSLGGNGPGSKLSAFNAGPQWTGNYLAAGVNALTMDLNNFGPSDLSLRLLVLGPFGPTGPTSLAFTSDAIFLPAESGWTAVTFLIGPENLTAGFGSITEALSGASELRLFHNPEPFFLGPGGNSIPSVQASLGVDNIRAAAIPEPGTLALAATGLLPLAGTVVRKRRRNA